MASVVLPEPPFWLTTATICADIALPINGYNYENDLNIIWFLAFERLVEFKRFCTDCHVQRSKFLSSEWESPSNISTYPQPCSRYVVRSRLMPHRANHEGCWGELCLD